MLASHEVGITRFASILPRNLPALFLSLATHIALVWAFAAQGKGGAGMVPSSIALSPALSVTLVTDKPVGSKTILTRHREESLNLRARAPVRDPSHGSIVPRTDRFGVLLSQTTYYFRTDELTEKPTVLRDVSPILSLGLPDAASQSAVMRLLINEFGEVDEVVFEEGELSSPIQELVRESLSKMRFKPGRVNNMPVKSQLKIEVDLEAEYRQ